MNSSHTTRRRMKLTTLTVALAMTLTLALPAQAVTVTAPCYTGGYFYSWGHAIGWQQHTHDGIRHTFLYVGTQWKSKSWGWHTGTQSALVVGGALDGAYAVCPN